MSGDDAVELRELRQSQHGRWRNVVATVRRRLKEDRVNVAAGAFAYRWFLSIFPMIIALLGVATLLRLPRRVVLSLLHGVTAALPSGAARVFTEAIVHATSRSGQDLTATVLASAVALWSAVSGMVIMEEGLDMAYGIEGDRTFLAKRLVALPLLLGGIVLGGGASALIVFGAALGTLIKDTLPFSAVAFAAVWNVARWILALVLINLQFSLLYYFAPNRARPPWRWTSVGAVLGTGLWALVSLAFSFYTSDFSSYAKTYGAFAGVAILIFWLFLTGYAILVGGEVNAAIERADIERAAVATP